jgi:hypothetical protein
MKRSADGYENVICRLIRVHHDQRDFAEPSILRLTLTCFSEQVDSGNVALNFCA